MASTTVKRYISIDLGQESGRVVLATVTDGRPEFETVHTFTMHQTRMAGKTFWNIYSIFDEVLRGLSVIGARRIQIESAGVNSWTSDFVYVARDGSFIGLPRCGREPLAPSVREKFFKKMSAGDYYRTTASQIQDSCTAFQLFAQHREKSIGLENARSILFISDALVYLLTGKKLCERTQLSASGLMNLKKGKVAKDVLKICHLKPKRIHSVVSTGAKVARLTDEVSAVTGLDKINVIAVAGNSVASAVHALPLEEESSAYLYVGPDAFMGIETAAPLINDRMFELNISNDCSAGGKFLVYKRLPGMEIMNSCLGKWRREKKDYSVEDIQGMLVSSQPASAMLDLCDPALSLQKDMPSAIAKYCSSNEMAVPADDAAVMRLVYESFADKCGDFFRKLQGISPFKIRSVYVFGPYAGDAFLNQLIAGECAVPVISVAGDVAACGNAAIQAGLSRQAMSNVFESQTYQPKTA